VSDHKGRKISSIGKSKDDVTDSQAALERHLSRVRRARRIYYPAIAVVVAAAAVLFGLVVANGEAANAHLSITKTPAPSPAIAPLANSLKLAWTSTDTTAIGQPVTGGTVITYNEHTVSGRNVRTGAVTWKYTRSDSRICNVAVEQGKAVAFYNPDGNCDEVDAFSATTGKRAWQRTLDQDGQPVNGNISVATTSDTVIAYTADVIYALEATTGPCTQGGPGCGLSRWNYPADKGCRIDHVVAGTTGALVSETCGDQHRVLLHDPYKQYTDSANTKVAVNWSHTGPAAAMPLAADSLVLVATGRGQATNYDPTSGKSISVLAVPGVSPDAVSAQVSTGTATLLWTAGQLVALDSATGRQQWTTATTALPDVDADGRLYVGTPTGIVSLDSTLGTLAAKVAVGRDLSGARLERVGAGVIVADDGTAAYF
jgi:outer membrane protein assembly factor BamB